MLTFTLNFQKNCFDVSVGFGFLLVTAVGFSDPHGVSGLCLIFCFTHELAHLMAMSILGAGLRSVLLYGGGVKIAADTENISEFSRLIIYSAGCLSNAAFALIFYFAGYHEAMYINIAIAIYNLLPVSYFDGGKILSEIFGRRAILTVMSNVSVIGIIALFFAMSLSVSFEVFISRLLTLFVIAVSELIDSVSG